MTFQTLFLRGKYGFKNNIMKHIQHLEGRFRLYIFQVSYIAEYGLLRKWADFYKSPGFERTKALFIWQKSDLNNSAPTASCANCYWEHHRGTYWEHLRTQKIDKIYLPDTPKY